MHERRGEEVAARAEGGDGQATVGERAGGHRRDAAASTASVCHPYQRVSTGSGAGVGADAGVASAVPSCVCAQRAAAAAGVARRSLAKTARKRKRMPMS